MRWSRARVVLAGAALSAVLAAVWWLQGRDDAAALATVVAAVLAATGSVAGWFPAQPTIEDRLESLAVAVGKQWNDEATVRRLQDKEPMAVRWRALDPWQIAQAEVIAGGSTAGRGPVLAAPLTKIVDQFDRLPRRRVVVIGEPGSGKSSVLLYLTLGLLERRTPADPVPILFSLASWDPKRTDFMQWLARHLSDEYPFVRAREARAIVAAGRVFPLLDGLDELPDGAAAAALPMINAAGFERPMVVACRTLEFGQAVHAGDTLTKADVVELVSLRPDQAEMYLRDETPGDDRLARWEPVFAELRRGAGSPVAAAFSTPLMVTLARTVYERDRGSDPADLVRCPSHEAIEERLLDALIPALYAGSNWSADRARAWLAFLAAHLRRRGTRDLAWWELAPGGAVHQIARAVGLGLALGLPTGLLVLQTGYNVSIADVLFDVISSAVLAGIGGAAAVGLSLVGLAALRRPLRLVLRLDWSFLRRLLIGAVTGFLVMLVLAFVLAAIAVSSTSVQVIDAPVFVGELTLLFGLVFGAPLGVAFGVVFGLVRPSEQPPTPASSLASNRLVSIVTLLVVGLSFPLLFLGASLLGDVNLPSVLGSATVGLEISLPIALGMAAVLPWGGYQLAHLWLALRGRLPWRLFAFLADAHQRGLLRQVGGVYQFRHARLQDRLAGH